MQHVKQHIAGRGNLTPEMARTSSYSNCKTRWHINYVLIFLLVSIFILVSAVFKGNISSMFTFQHRQKQTLIVNTCNDLPSTRRGRYCELLVDVIEELSGVCYQRLLHKPCLLLIGQYSMPLPFLWTLALTLSRGKKHQSIRSRGRGQSLTDVSCHSAAVLTFKNISAGDSQTDASKWFVHQN